MSAFNLKNMEDSVVSPQNLDPLKEQLPMVNSRFSLTFEEACIFLGYSSRTTLSGLINSSSPTLWEGIHYTCTGKKKRFDPDKLQDWLDTPKLLRKSRRTPKA